jgi:hypothetical protein
MISYYGYPEDGNNTLVNLYQTAWCHILEDSDLDIHPMRMSDLACSTMVYKWFYQHTQHTGFCLPGGSHQVSFQNVVVSKDWENRQSLPESLQGLSKPCVDK